MKHFRSVVSLAALTAALSATSASAFGITDLGILGDGNHGYEVFRQDDRFTEPCSSPYHVELSSFTNHTDITQSFDLPFTGYGWIGTYSGACGGGPANCLQDNYEIQPGYSFTSTAYETDTSYFLTSNPCPQGPACCYNGFQIGQSSGSPFPIGNYTLAY